MSRGGPAIARVLAVLAAIAVAGCGRSRRPAQRRDAGAVAIDAAQVDARPIPEVVMLRRVGLDVVAPTGGHEPARDPLVARLRRLGAGVVDPDAELPAGWAGRGGSLQVTLTYDLGGSPGAPTVLMTVEAALDLDGGALGAAARTAGEQVIGRRDRDAAVNQLATALVDQIATELTMKLTLRAGTANDLLDAATGADPEAAAWALELGGERGDRRLRAPAIAGLRMPPRIRTAAIQYLVAIGDPATVADLAASVDFNEPEELAAIIEAVTAIGGAEAREFLELLATGSTDADLARRAKHGLERLDRREDAAP